jgi:hypothetical protein
MTFDTVKIDLPPSPERAADYWRERAECLEEWICELLRKNQVLRMVLDMTQSQEPRREDTTRTSSLLSHYELPIALERSGVETRFETLAVGESIEECPTKQCAEIRKSVVQFALLNEFVQAANN